MECSFCSNPAKLYAQHFGKYFCKQHLERYLAKKLKKTLTKFKLVSKGDKILLNLGKSPIDFAIEDLFRKAVAKWPVEIVEKKHDCNKTLNPRTLDCEVVEIVEGLINGRIHETGYSKGAVVFPFRDFSSKELFVMGWLNGHKKEGKKSEVILKSFQGVAPKLSLLRSWDQIQRVSRQKENSTPQRSNKNKA